MQSTPFNYESSFSRGKNCLVLTPQLKCPNQFEPTPLLQSQNIWQFEMTPLQTGSRLYYWKQSLEMPPVQTGALVAVFPKQSCNSHTGSLVYSPLVQPLMYIHVKIMTIYRINNIIITYTCKSFFNENNPLQRSKSNVGLNKSFYKYKFSIKKEKQNNRFQ